MCFGELCLHAVGNDYEMRRKKLAGIIGILVFSPRDDSPMVASKYREGLYAARQVNH